MLVLKNPDTPYTAFYMHTFAANAKPATFTLSATFFIADSTGNGAGLMYCLNNSGAMKGYTLQLGVGQYVFCSKYPSAANLKDKFSTFVNPFPAANTIMVTKLGSVFNVFCNGHLITRFSDGDYVSGDIALLVPPGATIKVDDVLMTDQVQPVDSSACYADSFLTTASDAWSNPSEGEATFGGGHLVLNNTNTIYSSTIYTDGISSVASLKAVVSHKSGAGGYGVAFVQSDSNKVTPFAFLVDSSRRYSVVNPDSSTISSHIAAGTVYGALGTDTIEVLRFAKYWEFLINGSLQDSQPVPSDFRVDGFGLYASHSTALSCSYFVAGGDSTGARCAANPVISRLQAPGLKLAAPLFGKGSVVYDVRGRRVGVFDRASFGRSNLTAGLYFVVPAGQRIGSSRAFPVMKTGN
jgi:hypothetical protein